MFGDAGLAQGIADDPDAASPLKLVQGALNWAAKNNTFRWNNGTAEEIVGVFSAMNGAEAARPVRLKELGQRKWVEHGAVKEFRSVAEVSEWIRDNYLDPTTAIRRTLAHAGAPGLNINTLDPGAILQRTSTADAAAAGYGGEAAIQAAIGGDNRDLVQKVCAILEGKSLPGSVENSGTVRQLRFGGRRWEYEDEEGSWVPYEVEICERLSAAAAGSVVAVGNRALIGNRGAAGPEHIELLLQSAQSQGMRASRIDAERQAATNRWVWWVTSLCCTVLSRNYI